MLQQKQPCCRKSREMKKILRIWLTYLVLEKSQKFIEEGSYTRKKKKKKHKRNVPAEKMKESAFRNQ